MGWLLSHADLLGQAVLALHGLALAIVNLTDTPDPNDTSSKAKAVLATAYPYIEKVAGITSKAKQ